MIYSSSGTDEDSRSTDSATIRPQIGSGLGSEDSELSPVIAHCRNRGLSEAAVRRIWLDVFQAVKVSEAEQSTDRSCLCSLIHGPRMFGPPY